MQTSDKAKTHPRPGPATAECCADLTCESGLRNHYFEGKRLTPEMFRVEQRYLNERRWLLNRAIHGYGVVYGYAVDAHSGKADRKEQASTRLRIGGGLALDTCGRELLYTSGEVALGDLIPLDASDRRIDLDALLGSPPASRSAETPLEQEQATCWLLSVHYAEQRSGPVTIKDPCRCDRDEWDHVCETVRFSLRQVSCKDCCVGCDCELDCGCGGCCCGKVDEGESGPEPHEPADAPRQERAPARPLFSRGDCGCLCGHLRDLKVPACDGRLCEIEERCARVWVDLRHGVPLACLRVVPDDCGGWTIGNLDICGPRRIVKRNDVLFDLVRGCDLTYIDDFGWQPWHRSSTPVDFPAFAKGFGPDGQTQDEYVTRQFWVTFSKPVQEQTVAADCFAITVLSLEREGRWRGVQRVPITRIDPMPWPGKEFPGHLRGARIVVDGGWVEDALWGRGSVFYEATIVEIEVRGDFILDCNGQPVDANAVGRASRRTGNGSPGGTFFSTFPVGPRPWPTHGKGTPANQQPPAKGAAS